MFMSMMMSCRRGSRRASSNVFNSGSLRVTSEFHCGFNSWFDISPRALVHMFFLNPDQLGVFVVFNSLKELLIRERSDLFNSDNSDILKKVNIIV